MKRFLVFVFVIALCVSLVGCNKKSTEGLGEFEQLLTDDSNEESSRETDTPFAERVYVIIPQGCSAELSAKASRIADKIIEKTGVPVSVKYDNEDTLSQGNNLEILVGTTNRMRSQEVLASLKMGEYLCCWDRGAIVIGGRYEESTLLALDDFLERVLPGATRDSLMGENVRLEKSVEYDIERLTLNGYDLYDFTIVYRAENENCEREIATFLRDKLAMQSGYLLDVIPHTERTEQTGKAICVGNVLGDTEYWQSYEAKIKTLAQNDILVDGKGTYGLSAAMAELINKISAVSADKTVNVDLSSATFIEAKNASLDLCYGFVSGVETCVDQIYDFTERIRDDENDLIVFSPTSAEIAKHINFNKCEYAFYSAEMENGSVICVLYNADLFTNVTYDAAIAIASVTFESLSDGKEYRVSLYSDIADGAVYETDENDVLVFDTAVWDGEKTDGFNFVGRASQKSFFVDERFVVCEDFDAKSSSDSEWTNLFCSFEIFAPFCDEYLKLADAVK